MKTTRRFAALGAAVGAVAVFAGAAHADVKVVEAMTIDNPQLKAAMKSMAPEQRAQMAKMGIGGTILSTIYVSGGKSRTDVGAVNSTIVDAGSKKITTVNRTARTYSTTPFDSAASQAAGSRATVKPTGKTKLILGHLCRDYRVAVSGAGPSGGTVSGDVWAAADLPRPNLPANTGGMGALMAQWSKMAGMPLQMTLTLAGGPAGSTTVHMTAKSVSTTRLPASTFAVPAGYKPGPAYNPMAGMGGGMGR